MKKIFLCVAMMCIMSPFISADMLPSGYKYVDYCFELKNIDDYPDYTFLASFSILGEPVILQEGGCYGFYKFDVAQVHAIKNADFTSFGSTDEEKREFFINNSLLISSDMQIHKVSTVRENDPTKAIVENIDIVSLDNNVLTLKRSTVKYTFEDGTSEEVPYISQDVFPESSRKPLLPSGSSYALYLLFPLIALAIIVAILLKRSKK